MALENFFTLTEMNNGLTALSRVRELMDIIHQESGHIVKSAVDSMRQWSSIASAIASTENKDCLDLFIQLNGLRCIATWLKDALKFNNDTVDSVVEESIIHWLRALEKLNVDYDNLVSSEIWATVQDLCAYKSSKVRDKARVLFETWKTKRDSDTSMSGVENFRTFTNDEAGKGVDTETRCPEPTARDASISGVTPEGKVNEIDRDDPMLFERTDVDVDQVDSSKHPEKIVDSTDVEQSFDRAGPSLVPESTMRPTCPFGTADEPCSSAVSRLDSPKTEKELHNLESPSCKKQTPTTECSSEKLDADEEPETLGGSKLNSSLDAVNEVKSSSEVSSHKNSASSNSDDSYLQKASSSEKSWGDNKDLGAVSPEVSNNDLASNYSFGRKQMEAGKKSAMEMEYGIIDPLEVARQVAMEVERDLIDTIERSFSSSEKLPDDNMKQCDIPDSVSGEQSDANGGLLKEVADLADESSPMQQDSATSSVHLDGEHISRTQDQASMPAQVDNPEKGLCDFDLNQEVCSEEDDHLGNQISTPVSVVSASRATAPPGLPCTPLQFGGNLGWKGSAATSAFHPAALHRMPESNQETSIGASSSSSKQCQGYINFDLNLTEGVVARAAGGTFPDKKVLSLGLSSILPGESSVDTNSRRSEHLELDLNCASEDVCAPSDWGMGQFFPQRNFSNGYSNSSSSSKQPIRNLDLNDHPSFPNETSHTSFLTMDRPIHSFGGTSKSNDSMVSIMGTPVEVNKKYFTSQTPMPMLNDHENSELAFDPNNMGRARSSFGIGSVLPYEYSPAYGYNNIAHVPIMPLPYTQYGSGMPFPYTVDSRGAPVIPQIVGSASAFPQPPFVMNSSAPPSGSRPFRSSYDPNPRMFVESGSKDPTGLGLSLSSTHEQQVQSNAQFAAMSSVSGGKRKEPENRWEPYPFRPYTTPWK